MKKKKSFINRKVSPGVAKKVLITFSLLVSFVVVYAVLRTFGATNITHTFKIYPAGGGVVKNKTGTVGAYINCPSICVRSYVYNVSPISYEAFPSFGYRFVDWEGSPSIRVGSDYVVNPLNVSRTKNWILTANFKKMTDSEIANAMISKYISSCPILNPMTVEFGDARGYQAISYGSSGRIIVSPTHTADIKNIMRHEIYHIYDWRDNNKIDWGESIPPSLKPACMEQADNATR